VRRSAATAWARATTGARSSPLPITTITTWVTASFGGTTSPESSEWVITSPPISRVEAPHEVCQTKCCCPSRPWNWVLKARAKFCPRL